MQEQRTICPCGQTLMIYVKGALPAGTRLETYRFCERCGRQLPEPLQIIMREGDPRHHAH